MITYKLEMLSTLPFHYAYVRLVGLDFGAWQQDSIASAPTVCPAKMDGNHPKETVDKDNEEVIDVDQNEEAVGNRWNVHIS